MVVILRLLQTKHSWSDSPLLDGQRTCKGNLDQSSLWDLVGCIDGEVGRLVIRNAGRSYENVTANGELRSELPASSSLV